MNPDIKAKWIEALRSGKYSQGTCALKRELNRAIDRIAKQVGVEYDD